MSRRDTNRGLKIGLFTLAGLAVLAMGINKIIEYMTPVASSSGYSEFAMSAEPTSIFSSAFGLMTNDLEAQGFEVIAHVVSTNNVRFDYALESAGSLERLQCISIKRESLVGFVLHWTEPVLEPPSNPENAWRTATIRHDVFGAQTSGMHYKDLSTFKRVLEGVLVTYRNKTTADVKVDSGE